MRKSLYGSQGGGKSQDIKTAVNNAPGEYAKISEDWRQENFVTAISVIYFLRDREQKPDLLFPWLFQLLRHDKGLIRYAAVKMFTDEIWPLTVHIRFPKERYNEIKPEKADEILLSLFTCLSMLANEFYQPKYKKYKYADSLPPSPYKSVQMVLSQMEEACGRDYINNLIKRLKY